MRDLAQRIYTELAKTWRNPGRVRAIADRDKLLNYLRMLRDAPESWESSGTDEFQVRRYRTYEAYLQHQRSKRPLILRTDYDARFREALRQRLQQDAALRCGMSVLCLGARSGAEVAAFTDLGCFAVGIDVSPTARSRYVLHGDFQDLQWPDECVDVVYTNSLDHAFDIKRVVGEIRRVLKASGLLIVEAVRGSDEKHPPGAWESFYWSTVADLVKLLVSHSLRLETQFAVDFPWPAEHVVFTKGPAVNGPPIAPAARQPLPAPSV